MNILQLSDPHLLAEPAATVAGPRPGLAQREGLRAALDQLAEKDLGVDRVLLTGDLFRLTAEGEIRQRLLRWPHPDSN